jgi:hypothetical protein
MESEGVRRRGGNSYTMYSGWSNVILRPPVGGREGRYDVGAMLWHHEVPWHPDPAEALRSFQAKLFTAHHNFHRELGEWRDEARYGLQREREQGDPYELAEGYERQLAFIEQAASELLPNDPIDQLALLRRIGAMVDPDGFRSILDVKGVSDEGDTNVTRLLKLEDVRRLVGSDRPTAAQANAAVPTLSALLGRSESVCFAIFTPTGESCGWFFLGYTHD